MAILTLLRKGSNPSNSISVRLWSRGNMSGSDDLLLTRRSLLLRLRENGTQREIAWTEFHNVYAPIIGGFARKMGAPPQEVGDLVQEVLLGFYAAIPVFEYDPALGRFRGYLKACTWRVFQKHMGSQRLGGRCVDTIDPGDLAVEQAWNDIWESEKLHRGLEIVRQRCQVRPSTNRTFQAFNLYVLLERPVDEVAQELKMAVASVHQAKTRISRALKTVLQELEDSTA